MTGTSSEIETLLDSLPDRLPGKTAIFTLEKHQGTYRADYIAMNGQYYYDMGFTPGLRAALRRLKEAMTCSDLSAPERETPTEETP